ncbi:MAG: peptidylprolyl isomerase [Spirochaetota bacterium]|nr:peptidylprolyl isomerase [Spirochaetota bacterium]
MADDNVYATIEMSKGVIELKLAMTEAPKTSQNFVGLAKSGFYDGLSFHRVEPGFVVQGGDPSGNGTGGSDEAIPLEILCEDGTMVEGKEAPEGSIPALRHKKGAIAMARKAFPNSATSQFYITLSETPFLDGKYAVFGYVTKGQDVVDDIRIGDIMDKVTIEARF